MLISLVIAFLLSVVGTLFIDSEISKSTGNSLGCGGYIFLFLFLFIITTPLIYLMLNLFIN